MLFNIFLVSLILLFIYVNSLFYSISLLLIALILLSFIISLQLINSLTILILCIVYFGAIIILIGYICAICPNVNISSQFSFRTIFLLFTIISIILLPFFFYNISSSLISMTAYFYSSHGLFLFLFLIFMLLLTLLIVTSQYLIPKGPFRSLS